MWWWPDAGTGHSHGAGVEDGEGINKKYLLRIGRAFCPVPTTLITFVT